MKHTDKIAFYNFIANERNEARKISNDMQEVFCMLPKECKDITEETVKAILRKLPAFSLESDDEREQWLQRFFS